MSTKLTQTNIVFLGGGRVGLFKCGSYSSNKKSGVFGANEKIQLMAIACDQN